MGTTIPFHGLGLEIMDTTVPTLSIKHFPFVCVYHCLAQMREYRNHIIGARWGLSDFRDKSKLIRHRSARRVMANNTNQVAYLDLKVAGVAVFANNFNSHGFHEWERVTACSFNSHLSLRDIAAFRACDCIRFQQQINCVRGLRVFRRDALDFQHLRQDSDSGDNAFTGVFGQFKGQGHKFSPLCAYNIAFFGVVVKVYVVKGASIV
jgi:hypothetical protein